jgi:sulfoxide reductase heme-binding subunit YedZ
LKAKSWLKLGIGVAAFIPAGVITFRFVTDDLGANPIATAMNQLGLWTLILLLSSLACTPLKLVLGWKWPLQVRKLLGLCAFAYVCMHFLVYLVLDQFFAWDEIWKDVVKRKFITVGFAAFVLLIPLAITSTNGMVKRLGFARWKLLHRLVYAAASLGVIHFLWRVKVVGTEQLIYAGVLLLLLGVRVVFYLRERRPRPA